MDESPRFQLKSGAFFLREHDSDDDSTPKIVSFLRVFCKVHRPELDPTGTENGIRPELPVETGSVKPYVVIYYFINSREKEGMKY